MIQIKMRPHLLVALLLILLAASLSACNTDDSDSGGDTPPETRNEKLNGSWIGEYGAEKTRIFFLMNDGDIHAFDEKNKIFAGSYTYTTPDGAFTSTLHSSTGTIDIVEGTASEGDRLDGTYTRAGGQTVDVAMQFDADINIKASSLELLSGQWASEGSSCVIDKDGGTTGTFLDTCTINGVFSIIDANYNLYVFDADLTDCEGEGQYHGLAALVDNDNVQNSQLIAVASDSKNEHFLILAVDRQ
jgi:hypothetical protein